MMLGSQVEENLDDTFEAKELLRVHKASLHQHYVYTKSLLNQTDLVVAAVIMFFIVITVTS